MRGLFVTGTDTAVGKTLVATALVRGLVSEGARVAVMKPIAAGAERTEEGLRNDDALALMKAANVPAPYCIVNPYCFAEPVAPHIAADRARIVIDIGRIGDCHAVLAAQSAYVLVEGAGGWQVPINEHQTMADVATLLKLPVLLVVALRLGCLNHAILTRRSIDAQGSAFAGWIANMAEPPMARLPENLATLERLMGTPPLAVVPHLPQGEIFELREAARLLMG